MAREGAAIPVGEANEGGGPEDPRRGGSDPSLHPPADLHIRALQASPDPVLLTRLPDHVVLDASDALLALTGHGREEVLGRPAGELGLEPILGGASGGSAEDPRPAREISFHLPGREPLTLRVSSVSFEHEGDRYALTVARDVTEEVRLARELRRSEERYRGIFTRAQEGLFRTDLDGRIVAANLALARIAGYGSVEELLRRAPNVRDICPDPARRAALLQELERRGSVEGFEVELRRADGSSAWISLSVHSVQDEHGRTVAREGSVVDITAVKLLALERTRLASEIVRALEAERAAIAEDVHDDPVQKMTAVGLRLDMLREALAGTEQEAAVRRLADDVRTAIGRLRSLIFDLHPSTLTRGGLAQALRDLVQVMAERWPFEIELSGALEREPPAEVAIVLYRVAQEALANAARHARASRVRVTLETVDTSVRVVVEDDGVGFDPARAAEPRPGHLGLQAMRERIRLVGGRWEIRSAPGAGTTVEFVVPLEPSS